MKLTRRQLKTLIENYLLEQDAISGLEGEEVEDSESTDGTQDDAPAEEAEDAGSEDAPEEETEPGEALPDKFKPFEIIIDGVKHVVQFVKDKGAGVLKLKIDGVEIRNPQPQDFTSMAGLALQGDPDDEERAALETIVKSVDKSFAKFSDVAKAVKDKMNAERSGFGVKDFRITVGKKDR